MAVSFQGHPNASRKRKRGFVPNGYDFLGTGHEDDHGPPRGITDMVAKDHDNAYGKYLEQGLNPYINYNDADEKARLEFGSDWGGRVGHAVFTGKKYLHKAGVLGHLEPVRKKHAINRLRGTWASSKR